MVGGRSHQPKSVITMCIMVKIYLLMYMRFPILFHNEIAFVKLWLVCDKIQEWQHIKWNIEPAAYMYKTCEWLFTWTLLPPARCAPRANHEGSRFVAIYLVHQHLRISSTEYVFIEVYMLVTNWKYISLIYIANHYCIIINRVYRSLTSTPECVILNS